MQETSEVLTSADVRPEALSVSPFVASSLWSPEKLYLWISTPGFRMRQHHSLLGPITSSSIISNTHALTHDTLNGDAVAGVHALYFDFCSESFANVPNISDRVAE